MLAVTTQPELIWIAVDVVGRQKSQVIEAACDIQDARASVDPHQELAAEAHEASITRVSREKWKELDR
jgi:hypothetical protein